MPSFHHDGLSFHYLDSGKGASFIFQHGLGGDVSQPFGLFKPPAGIRLLAFDCRAHGETRPLGDESKIGIASFADDLLAFMNQLTLRRAVVGGISMGAAVALNFALRYPDRLLGLVLSRPAWLDQPYPHNARVFPQIAELIRDHGAVRGGILFAQSDVYKKIRAESPDAAESLLGQFLAPRARETVVKLERIINDTPCHNRQEWRDITVPTLILANRQDPIHPFEYGEVLAQTIPSAVFRELTPKSVSKERHTADVQKFIEEFLKGIV